MRRHFDLIRNILIAIEKHPQATGFVPLGGYKISGRLDDKGRPRFDGHEDLDVSYHVKLMADMGLILAVDVSTATTFEWRAQRLTADGHDLVEAIRDDARWQGIKKRCAAEGKILTLETIWFFARAQQKLWEAESEGRHPA